MKQNTSQSSFLILPVSEMQIMGIHRLGVYDKLMTVTVNIGGRDLPEWFGVVSIAA